MITGLNILLGCLWFASAFVDYADFAYLWQLKEYRLDRMRDFFSTHQGKMYWLKYNLIPRSFVVLVLFFWPINSILVVKYALIAVFSFDLLHAVYLYLHHRLKRPRITFRSMLLVVGSLFAAGLAFLLSRDWATLLLLLMFRFFIISSMVFLSWLPTRLLKRWYIQRAEQKLASYKNLLIIGITGSYGKTTVKTFLSHILKAKYRVVHTPKNTNTDIGIAKFILASDFKDFDIFVVEMGAYRRGEIQAIADMVHPTIGILTAINEQHIVLFGNIKNTQAAKYELLRSIPKHGLCITNSDNPYCREFIGELSAPVQTFGYDEEFAPAIRVVDTVCTDQNIACSFALNDQTLELHAPIIGVHNCTNLAPCILVARHLGISNEQIEKQAPTLTLPDKTLHTYQYGSALVIDDSYNSNPDGFKSALQVLSSFPSEKKRFVITRGMLELGEQAFELHERIAGEISFTTDELVLISRDYEEAFKIGMGRHTRTVLRVIEDPETLLAFVRTLRNIPCVILIENRIPGLVYTELMNNGKKESV